MHKSIPLISVVMSIYKEPEYMLRQSIESILFQSMDDFELIIILDCPDYEGNSIVEEYASNDERIKVIYNVSNLGLTKSLNKGLKCAKGKYIARMDADDISELCRLEVQYRFMEKNSEVSVVGAYIDGFDEKGNHIIGQNNCTENMEINRIRMLFCNAGIAHSTAFMRKSFLDEKNICYDENMKKSQDYGLWTDIVMQEGRIEIIHEVLLRYRIHSKQITNVNADEQRICLLYNIRKQFSKYFNCSIDENEAKIHYSLYHFDPNITIKEYEEYIEKLIKQNKKYHCFNDELFIDELQYMLLKNIIKAVVRFRRISFLKSKYLINRHVINVVKKLIVQEKSNRQYKRVLEQYIKCMNEK